MFKRTALFALALLSFPLLEGCSSNNSTVHAGGGELSAAPTMNALFQARNPRTCAAVKHKPSEAEAAALVQCRKESLGAHTLYLVSDVQVQMGGGRPFNSKSDMNLAQADTTSTVYPIRGSMISYNCSPPSRMTPSKNTCYIVPDHHPSGACFKTTFADWDCYLQGTENAAGDYGPPPASY